MRSIESPIRCLTYTKRLLIVEDNDIEREGIVELLRHDDIEVVAVATGAEALNRSLEQPFDCCVVDLRLPDITGFQLLEKVQPEPILRDIPIVVFTGKELTKRRKFGCGRRKKRAAERCPIPRTAV